MWICTASVIIMLDLHSKLWAHGVPEEYFLFEKLIYIYRIEKEHFLGYGYPVSIKQEICTIYVLRNGTRACSRISELKYENLILLIAYSEPYIFSYSCHILQKLFTICLEKFWMLTIWGMVPQLYLQNLALVFHVFALNTWKPRFVPYFMLWRHGDWGWVFLLTIKIGKKTLKVHC